jgi:hypothetical protein
MSSPSLPQALQADETAHFNRRILVSVVTDTERKTLTGARRLCITRFADGTRDEKYIHEGTAPMGGCWCCPWRG